MDMRTAQDLGMQLVVPGHLADLLPPGPGITGGIPFEEHAIRERVDSHVLIPIFPVSIMEIVHQEVCKPLARRLHYHGEWWYQEPSLKPLCEEPMEARWALVSRDPILYTDVHRLWCRYGEISAPYEPRLSARESLYVLLVAELFCLRVNVPDRDYAILAFDDVDRPDPYTVWHTGSGYLLNNLGPGQPLRIPYYGLTEYLEVGDGYEKWKD